MFVRWFYFPSLIFLLLALLSGIWLRLQWGWPLWQLMGMEIPKSLFFRPEFLLHGHSHVALLGWTFFSLTGFILEAGTRRAQLPVKTIKALSAITIVVVVFLFVAFASTGYAPISIALSTSHMLLSYALAWIFFRHARNDGNTGSNYFFEGAVGWMVLATAGPWLLAAGGSISPFWINVSVHYYLHVLFNGWLLFGLAGLSWRYIVLPGYHKITWPFWLMMLGLLPALLPQLGHEASEWLNVNSFVLTVSGMAGSILFAAGGMAVVIFTIISRWKRRSEYRAADILLWVGLVTSFPLIILPVFMAWPPIREWWSQSDFLTVGFIHLHLLVVVSNLLVYALVRRITRYYGSLLQIGLLLFSIGSIIMVLILILTGIFQLSGFLPPYPVQKSLFHSGWIILLGAVLLTVEHLRQR